MFYLLAVRLVVWYLLAVGLVVWYLLEVGLPFMGYSRAYFTLAVGGGKTLQLSHNFTAPTPTTLAAEACMLWSGYFEAVAEVIPLCFQ